MKHHHRRCPWFFCVLGALAVTLTGCSGGPKNAPVDADSARTILRTALDSWKKGDRSNALQSASPPIYINDSEWEAGAKLKDYQVVGEGDEKDAHLFARVKLTVVGPGGQESKRDVTYIISTAPNRTVFRKVF